MKLLGHSFLIFEVKGFYLTVPKILLLSQVLSQNRNGGVVFRVICASAFSLVYDGESPKTEFSASHNLSAFL